MRIFPVLRDLGGNSRRQRVVKYLRELVEIEELPLSLGRLSRFWNLIQCASLNRSLWRERSKKNPAFFRLASMALERSALARGASPNDRLLLFEALYGVGIPTSPRLPYAVFEDATPAQASRCWPPDAPDTSRSPLYRGLVRECYHRAHVIFTSNEAAGHSLQDDFGVPASRIINVGQGCDFATDCSLVERQPGSAVLFVGYDFERKGGPTLLQAFRLVRAEFPLAQLLLIGPDLPSVDPGVEVLGRVSDRSRLRSILATAAVFALPANFDPMPHAALEAMSLGVPTIVSTACGTQELIIDGQNGYVVPPRDIPALAARLSSLLRDPALARSMGEAGASTIRSRCSWLSVARRIIEALRPLQTGHSVSSRTC